MQINSLTLHGLLALVAAVALPACSTTSTKVAVSWLSNGPSHLESAAESVVETAVDDGLDRNEWTPVGDSELGDASWYSVASSSNLTASGEPMLDHALCAAHKTLPLGTMVHIRNLETGRSVVARINDRGPYIAGRIIDVTPAVARELNLFNSGHAACSVQVIKEVESLPEDKGTELASKS